LISPLLGEGGMRSNVELKARYPDHERALRILRELGAKEDSLQRQVDTYFQVDSGKLKLREIDGSASELIFYRRSESSGLGQECRYVIFKHADPSKLKEILVAALGIRVQVRKERRVFWLEGVKINLDEVEGLGRFIEFEALADECGKDTAEKRVADLVGRLGIAPQDIASCSYSDMLSA